MPEGPEIRRAAAQLARVLVGRPLTRIEYRLPRLARRARRLAGTGIRRVYTHGKSLLIEYDCGITHYSHNQLYGEWHVHVAARASAEGPSVRVVIATARHRAELWSATDIELLRADELARHPFLSRLGPDVFDPALTPAAIAARLVEPRHCGRSLGALLLDQRFVAGLGNYLRSDILFVAGLRADARPRDLSAPDLLRLSAAIRTLPRQSFRTGGVTNDVALARRLRAQGRPFADYRFRVYAREGERCWACGSRIRRADAGGRGLFYCPRCQPA